MAGRIARTKLTQRQTFGFRRVQNDARAAPVINVLTLALTHGLMALAAWRLLARRDLDEEEGTSRAETRPWLKRRESGDA